MPPSEGPPVAPPRSAAARLERPPGEPCSDAPEGRIAYVGCDGDRVFVTRPLAFHPKRRAPPPPVSEALHSVAGLLGERQDILLLRIEVYSSADVGNDPRRARSEIDATQRRADALFRHLWRREGVWAERLEGVGYGAAARFVGSSVRWPVVLRIVQRAASP